mmetsp:Transcript_1434/g.3239  ORF Transcript_1434/g.3239 Transcript_1434/m.3239 type:complete len:214 (+) Transcript_1434:290-931(+)
MLDLGFTLCEIEGQRLSFCLMALRVLSDSPSLELSPSLVLHLPKAVHIIVALQPLGPSLLHPFPSQALPLHHVVVGLVRGRLDPIKALSPLVVGLPCDVPAALGPRFQVSPALVMASLVVFLERVVLLQRVLHKLLLLGADLHLSVLESGLRSLRLPPQLLLHLLASLLEALVQRLLLICDLLHEALLQLCGLLEGYVALLARGLELGRQILL